MKKVLFLTNRYPYLPGEQFIEVEINYWAENTSIQTILVPLNAAGVPRKIPEEIKVDLTVAQSSTPYHKIKSLIPAFFSSIFWSEVVYIYKTRGVDLSCFLVALKATGHVLRIKKALISLKQNLGAIDIAYCYWNEVQCYAAVLLKKSGLIEKVISRAHGGDLYENRRLNNYMPLKRQFIDGVDSILPISNSGKSYLENKYEVSAENIGMYRLGVPIPHMMAEYTGPSRLEVLSVSYCKPVKRIDKIIDGIASAAKVLGTEKKIHWTHIGSGPLFEELMMRAADKLTSPNIEWVMLGAIPNEDVKTYYMNNPVDLFINASESEGIPVSIMEAMSFGVPAIAPDVGGVSELVDAEFGYLLSKNPTIEDIAEALIFMSIASKMKTRRDIVRKKIINEYCAEVNYRGLVKFMAG